MKCIYVFVYINISSVRICAPLIVNLLIDLNEDHIRENNLVKSFGIMGCSERAVTLTNNRLHQPITVGYYK